MKNKIKICCVLFAVFALVMSTGTFATPAYARFQNTAAVRTVLEASEPKVISDCFYKSGEPKTTVMLGKFGSEPITAEFKVKPVGGDYKKTIEWIVPEKDISLEVKYNGTVIKSGTPIDAMADAEKIFSITVEDVGSYNTDTPVEFSITWGELSGNFCVIIPATKNLDMNGSSGEQEENTEPQTAENTAAEQVAAIDSGNSKIKAEAPFVFDPEHLFPVKLSLSDNITKVVVDDLPAKTKYSTDGSSYKMLWFGGTAEEENISSGFLYFDFSRAELTENLDLTFKAFSEETSAGSSSITAVPKAQDSCFVSVKSIFGKSEEENTEGSAGAEASSENILTNDIVSEGPEIPVILSVGKYLEATFPEEWKNEDYSVEYSLFVLEKQKDGTLGYRELALSDGDSSEEEKNKMVFEIKNHLVPAGTYLMKIKWRYKDLRFYETEIPFFINYSNPTFSTVEYQEVPNGN